MSLSAALDVIESGTVKSRREGFADVKRILRLNSRDLSRLFPKERVILDFFDRLTKVVASDRRVYLSSQASASRSTQTTVTNKFADSIRACRHAVELTVHVLKYKSFSFLVDCFSGWLHDNDGKICLYVADECLKTLAELVEHQPHLEHLPAESWNDLCKKACKYLEDINQASNAANSAELRLLPDYARLLKALTSTACMPLHANAPLVYRPILKYLDNVTQAGERECMLLTALNNVIQHAVTESFPAVRADLDTITSMIEKLWSKDITRRPELRDEAMAIVACLLPMLEQTAIGNSASIFQRRTHALYTCLRDGYLAMPIAEHLQVEDIRLVIGQSTLCTNFTAFRLCSRQLQAHRAWLQLTLTVRLLDISQQAAAPQHDAPRSPRHHKRRRVDGNDSELTRFAQSPSQSTATAALQALAISFQLVPMDEEVLLHMLEFLLARLNDSDQAIVAWVYIALTSLSTSVCSSADAATLGWKQLWVKAVRALKSAHACRYASFTLHCLISYDRIDRQTVSEQLSTFKTSLDVLGPSTLSDGSAALACTLISFCKSYSPASFGVFSTSVIDWTFGTFSSTARDPLHSKIQPSDMTDVVAACLQRPTTVVTLVQCATPWARSSRSSKVAEQEPFLRYLLSLPASDAKIASLPRTWKSRSIWVAADGDQCINTRLLQHMHHHVQRCTRDWDEAAQKDSAINEDLIGRTCLMLRTCEWLLDTVWSTNHDAALVRSVIAVFQRMCLYLTNNEPDSLKLVTAIELMLGAGPMALDCSQKDRVNRHWDPNARWMSLLADLARHFSDDPASIVKDSMNEEIFDDFEELDVTTTRLKSTSDMAYKSAVKIAADLALGQLLDEVSQMTAQDFVSSSKFLLNVDAILLRSIPDLIYQLLNSIAETVMQDYSAEQNDEAFNLTLHLLKAAFDDKADLPAGDYLALCVDLYAYFCDAWDQKKLSAAVQERVVEVLLQIWATAPGFAQDQSDDQTLPSVRTTLFKAVRSGLLLVQYHISLRISDIFSFFTAANHDALFEDLESQIVANVADMQSLAVRISFLCHIGTKWQTLLRKAVWYIFEIAGEVPDCSDYAAKAIRTIAHAHHFSDPQAVFQIFSPQIVHTWMNSGRSKSALSDMPFAVFGFGTLKDMLSKTSQELTAQCLIYQKPVDLDFLKDTLAISENDLYESSLHVSFTYIIAHDVSQRQGEVNLEPEFRKKFRSSERYVGLVKQNLPRIVAKLLLSTELDGGVERHWEKTATYSSIHAAMKDIQQEHGDDQRLPAKTLQPCFKGRYLMHSLERILRRGALTLAQTSTEPFFIAIARHILDAIHPSLGSFNCQAMLQRLQILCALSCEMKSLQYAGDMLIHAMRPFLSDVYCNSEAVSIVRWAYLRTPMEVPFLAANALYTLHHINISLSDQSIAESQRNAARLPLEKLKQFLLDYVVSQCEAQDDAVKTPIGTLMRLGAAAVYPLNFARSSAAAELLQHLLGPTTQSTTILAQAGRKKLVQVILSKSTGAVVEDDAFGTYEAAITYGRSILEAIDLVSIDEALWPWLGRLAGKYYSATGQHINVGTPKGHTPATDEDRSTYDAAVVASRRMIIDTLVRSLTRPTRREVSAAENALRDMISAHARVGTSKQIQELMPQDLFESLQMIGGVMAKIPPVITANAGTLLDSVGLDENTLAARTSRLIIGMVQPDPWLDPLTEALDAIEGFASDSFCAIQHLALAQGSQQEPRRSLSGLARTFLQQGHPSGASLFLRLILFLLEQPRRDELSRADRLSWLDIDPVQAAQVAIDLKWSHAALLLVELSGAVTENTDLHMAIYDLLDDPDSFYGVSRPLATSMAEQIDRAEDDWASLRMHTAIDNNAVHEDKGMQATLTALSRLRMDAVARSLLSQPNIATDASVVLNTARRLQDWDIQCPEATDGTADNHLFNMYQSLACVATEADKKSEVIDCITAASKIFLSRHTSSIMPALAVMAETLTIVANDHAHADFQDLEKHQVHWKEGHKRELLDLISHRQSVAGTIRRNHAVTEAKHKACLQLEVRSGLRASQLAAEMQLSEYWFNEALNLHNSLPYLQQQGLRVSAVVTRELASSMWQAFREKKSIAMLQALLARKDLDKETIPIHKAVLFAELGRKIADARLERPTEIMSQYLKPALDMSDKGLSLDDEAMICHEFARFCDAQIQDTEAIDEMRRLQRMRDLRHAELKKMETIMKGADKQAKNDVGRKYRKQRSEYELDKADLDRQRMAFYEFIEQALSNYLRALSISDKYNGVVTRFFALWMEHREVSQANKAVDTGHAQVSTWKFAGLANQILARLGDSKSGMHASLSNILSRLCKRHPLKCMHSLFATCHASTHGDDAKAMARKSAAEAIAKTMHKDKVVGELYRKVWEANKIYDKFAQTTYDKGGRTMLKSITGGRDLERTVPGLAVPPPTLDIAIQPSGMYAAIPVIHRFRSQITIASGLSAPKIVTAIGSDGKQYKMLYKGGNDDLRQDQVMEQVFASVSEMLKKHEPTRRRSLGIRTYIVLPLTSNSGIIEFVPNSIPLHDYLVPAHGKYYPSDMNWDKSRNMIKTAQDSTKQERLKAFQKVTKEVHPVLRHFFLERFASPSEWFARRLAYSRSTAAISILGFVLGLGDRHCHNILLDEKTGEVVHIDLGIAFEAGRVLPIPETVPFRLTRDIVDGMGITGVEGVFRRCCEFTLEALRLAKSEIMTILDVLRYDPLYAWTVTPLRAKRIQEDVSQGAEGRAADDGGEAARALGVVERKLSSSLMVEAQVNELIQVASDESNLSLLFAGWSAMY